MLIEIHGAVHARGKHTRGKGLQNDCDKHNEAVLLGYRTFIFTTEDVMQGKALTKILEYLGREQ